MINTAECITVKEYFSSSEFITDMKHNNLSADEAKSVYYRCINREETNRINIISKISPNMGVDASTEKNLHEIKNREQFKIKLEIFRREFLISIENTVLDCLMFNRPSSRRIKETAAFIENIKEDLEGKSKDHFLIFGTAGIEPAVAYHNLMKDYARKGISDILYLSELLYKTSKGIPLTATKTGMVELCSVWLAVINEYCHLCKQLIPVYQTNEEFLTSLFKGKTAIRRDNTEKDRIVRELIISCPPEEREKILAELASQAILMDSARKKMKAAHSFLQSYYSEILKKHMEVHRYLQESICNHGRFHPRNNNTRMLFVSFAVILKDIKARHVQYQEKNLINFGIGGLTYSDITRRLILTIEVLHSAYLQLANISVAPAMSKKFCISGSNTLVTIQGGKKAIPFTTARDFCRNRLNELKDEIQFIRNPGR